MESSSKVTVTYWDPSSLFPLIEPELRAHLPLRNLHWKSPTRPLRSISTLHVELVPYTGENGGDGTALTSTASNTSTTTNTNSISGGSTTTAIVEKRSSKRRRHQIPGLRNTPYLKLYILRCDDNETYKSVSRKLVREWVGTYGVSSHPSDSGTTAKQQHEAAEWLVVHVVLPGTAAYAQARASSSLADGVGGGGVGGVGGRGAGAGGSADRVVQLRVHPTNPMLPTLSPPVPVPPHTLWSSLPEPAEETARAYGELVAKMKSHILASFDTRVARYEQDVRERDAQRRLPGWNFCTFFVLKEGLARAFESVGLVEDALVLYDELAVGLQGFLAEGEEAGGEKGGVGIERWTEETRGWLRRAQERLRRRKTRRKSAAGAARERATATPTAASGPYRDLILSNRISVFDFECYLFARQSNLLLRLGGAHNSVVPTPTLSAHPWGHTPATATGSSPYPPPPPADEDLKHLTALLKRGLAFVTTVGRILREDLYLGWQAAYPSGAIDGGAWTVDDREETERGEKDRELAELVEDIVGNWMFGICMQLLDQTEARAIPREVLWGVGSGFSGGGPGAFPRRTSSLPGTPGVEQGSFAQLANPGLEEVCAARGDLLVLARSLVEGFARRKGWVGEWGSDRRGGKKGWFEKVETPGLTEVSLDDAEDSHDERGEKDDKIPIEVGCGVSNRTLRKAVESELGFYELFEELSEKARRHFALGKKAKSGERVVADLAALRFHLRDYKAAAAHLEQLTLAYAGDGWGLIETSLLTMYARCLKKMGRKEDYVRALLRLLRKDAERKLRWDWRRVAGIASPADDEERYAAAPIDVRGYVGEVVTLSSQLSQHVTAPMTAYWSDILVDPYPRHLDGRDGFKLLVKFRYLLDEPMTVQAVRVRIVSMLGGAAGRDIWFSTAEAPLSIRKGTQRLWLETRHNIPGTYIVDQIVVAMHNVSFVHEILGKTTPATPVALTASNAAAAINAAKRSRLHLWPARESLSVHLRLPPVVHLDRGRKIEVVLSPGWNNVISADVSIKSATAGLRMMMREVELVTALLDTGANVKLEGGKIYLANIPAHKNLTLRIPYSAERGELADLAVKIEVNYTTDTGEYVYSGGGTVGVALPLAVNVQDVFKGPDVLFSKFQVSTALDIPLWVEGVRLDTAPGDTTYIVESASGGAEIPVGRGGGGWLVVPRQPGQFVYRIRKNPTTTLSTAAAAAAHIQKRTLLQLEIKYTRLDTQLTAAILSSLRTKIPAEMSRYAPLLNAHLLEKLPQVVSTEGYELAGVTGDVGAAVPSYARFSWEDAIRAGVGNAGGERRGVEEWVRAWWEDEGETETETEMTNFSYPLQRALVIPVEVPRVDVVCSAQVTLHPVKAQGEDGGEMVSTSGQTQTLLNLGDPVRATLTITWSRAWSPSPPTIQDRKLEAYYQQQTDTYLISGRKRGSFYMPEGQVSGIVTVGFWVVPLRSGRVGSLGVEVKVAEGGEQVAEGGGEGETLEVECVSAAEMVVVVRDVRSVGGVVGGGGGGVEEGVSSAGGGGVAGTGVAGGLGVVAGRRGSLMV
ncbi:hypothetical protein DFH27DRAFT_514584 [Peziza echinospora]|nr:hypothetical protein DFH27DRAFT_514584 [Peziza echinospora]